MINSCFLCAVQIFTIDQIKRANPIAISFLILFFIIEILLIVLFARLPVHKSPLYFQVCTIKKKRTNQYFISSLLLLDSIRTLCTYLQCINQHLFNFKTITNYMDTIRCLDVHW